MGRHASLDSGGSPVGLSGTQLCTYVSVPNKVVGQPVPFQVVQEASSEQCHGSYLKFRWLWWEGWTFPWRRSCSRVWVCAPLTASVHIHCGTSVPGRQSQKHIQIDGEALPHGC